MTDYRTVPVEPDDKIIRAMCVAIENTDTDVEEANLRDGYDCWRPVALAAWSAALSASPAPAGDLVERVARTIAEGLGDNFDHAFVSKPEWTAARGEKGGRYRDVNEPMQPDYMDAARALIAAMQPGWRDKPHCQSCGGEIQGWTCQGCGLTFRENDAGRLVAEPLPAPPGVGG
jgi:hypothetical protein